MYAVQIPSSMVSVGHKHFMREMMALGAAKFQTASGGMKDDDNTNNAPFKIRKLFDCCQVPSYYPL